MLRTVVLWLAWAVLFSACGSPGSPGATDNTPAPNDGERNAAPTIQKVAISPAAPYASTPLHADADAADSDGDKVEIRFQWQKAGDNGFEDVEGATEDMLPVGKFSKGDIIAVTATPDDGQATGRPIQSDPVVIGNAPPRLGPVSLSPGPYTEATTIVVSVGDVSDDDASDLPAKAENFRFRWLVDGVPIGVTDDRIDGRWFQKGQTVRVDVSYTDGTDTSPAQSASATIANSAPAVLSVAWTAGPYVEQCTIKALPLAADPDGDAVSYSYTWYVNGVSVPVVTGDSIDGTHFNKGNSIAVRVVPRDNDASPLSGAGLLSSSIVIDDSPPQLGAATLASIGLPAYGTDATVYVDAWTGLADADGDAPVLLYQWYGNGVPLVGQTSRILSGAFFEKGDTVYALVTPYDGQRYGLPVSTPPVAIVDSPPAMSSVAFGAGPFRRGDTLVAVALGTSDSDAGDTVFVDYRWFVNGIAVSSEASLATGFAKGDTVTVAARVTDGLLFSAWIAAMPATIHNSKPVLGQPAIHASPLPVTQGSTLTASAAGYDADGDPVSLQYAWRVNNVTAGSGPSLNGASFNHFDDVTVSLTPFDGEDSGAAVTAPAVPIRNSPPSKPVLSFAPEIYRLGDSLSVSAVSTDADGDTVRYQYRWFGNGAPRDWNVSTIDAAQVDSDTWTVVVTPDDGYAVGATAWAVHKLNLDRWTPVAAAGAPEARRNSVVVWTGSEVFIWGGSNAVGDVLDSGFRYDPATDTWSAASALTAPTARENASAVWTGKHVIVWGGQAGGTMFDSGAKYDPATDTWAAITSATAPSPRARHAAVWSGHDMIIFGGADGAGALDTGARYDPLADQWAPLPATDANRPAARYDAFAVWTGDVMLVWGGTDGASDLDSGAVYDPRGQTWRAMSSASSPGGRSGAAAVWTGNAFVVWGGLQNGSAVSTGARYDVQADAWTATNTAGAPAARTGHSAVFTGRDMIVWGGDSAGLLQSGGRYDPWADRWAALDETVLNLPTARTKHTALWTGRDMFVWGGEDATGLVSTAARYLREGGSETWTPMSPGLTGRWTPAAVWTGSEMILYGGNGSSGPNGERYQPATDTWLALNSVNDPGWVTEHRAVWTGREMIVTGGYNPVYYTTAVPVAKYDPATDAWTNLPYPGVYGATIAWTGRELIAWGGNYGWNNDAINEGRRYDLLTGTVTSMSQTNAPGPRGFATTVWTGRELMVWGGKVHYGALDTGALYDPETDTWRPMSQASAPGPRTNGSAVWTGKQVLLWFGPNDGGRYDPASDEWLPIGNAGRIGEVFGIPTWTGREMIVCGYQPCGRFDPERDRWSMATGVNAPPSSAYTSAVWTGHSLMLYGAEIGGGKIYTPPVP